MADNIQRYGLRFHSTYHGTGTPPLERYRVVSGYQAAPSGTNVDLYAGDPVVQVAGGGLNLATAGATNQVLGVISHFSAQQYGGNAAQFLPWLDHLPGGTTWTAGTDQEVFAYVIPVAGQIFEIDVDDNVTATTQSAYETIIGHNVNLSYTPSSTLKKAFPQALISTNATTNTFQFRIIDISRQVNIDYSGKFVKLLVTANNVQQAPYQTTGI